MTRGYDVEATFQGYLGTEPSLDYVRRVHLVLRDNEFEGNDDNEEERGEVLAKLEARVLLAQEATLCGEDPTRDVADAIDSEIYDVTSIACGGDLQRRLGPSIEVEKVGILDDWSGDPPKVAVLILELGNLLGSGTVLAAPEECSTKLHPDVEVEGWAFWIVDLAHPELDDMVMEDCPEPRAQCRS